MRLLLVLAFIFVAGLQAFIALGYGHSAVQLHTVRTACEAQ